MGSNFRDQNDPGMSWLDFELFLLQVLKINFCRKELNEKNIFWQPLNHRDRFERKRLKS